jgi:hypothetical protein
MAYNTSNIKKTHPLEPPCRKKMYNSFEEAQDEVKYIMENRDVREIHPYKCMYCGFWHLTSKPKK